MSATRLCSSLASQGLREVKMRSLCPKLARKDRGWSEPTKSKLISRKATNEEINLNPEVMSVT